MVPNAAKNIDEYIAGFPEDIQARLQLIRQTVKKAAPDAVEAIKYAMPAFVLKGNLVFFAAFKNHIGFYPAPTGNPAFAKDLAIYKTGKGSVQFPLEQPVPLDLITRIVKLRIRQNTEAEEVKRMAKKVKNK
ncbi:iron chaperone [Foetidibacter luteolus]|uniref:iron chaperone n=1 Tax=Foetidibacter luteolus TaxID=2608880 RepID=UPI00129AAEAE|nr:DUF1801 domain-containing protein [Foetidibacter luteolus]